MSGTCGAAKVLDLYGVVPLDLAVLCEDCRRISAVRRDSRRQCPKCASEALTDLEPVLDRNAGETMPDGYRAGAQKEEMAR